MRVHKDSVRTSMMWRQTIFGVLLAMVSGCSFAQSACSARNPEQALPPGWIVATKESASLSSTNFYRLTQIVVDPELHRRWALIANCTHPERPLEIVALSRGHVIVPTRAAKYFPLLPSISGLAQHRVSTEVASGPAIPPPPNVLALTAAVIAKTSVPDPSTTVPVIRAGDLVRLWSSDGNVRLEMAAVSVEYGRVGQIIHVRRMGQTALLAGVVVGEDSAELIP
jgi:hypothetical protein